MNNIDDIPCSKIRLNLSAKNLYDSDVFSKSDPMCVVYLARDAKCDGNYHEIARTETIRNCLNPEWCKPIFVDYYFEEVQRVKFEIYDIDNTSCLLSEHDYLGKAESTLAEIVGAPSSSRILPLIGPKSGRKNGEIKVIAEEADD
ncbi:unnamed protein product, partial [Dracunculus medinensis]|uniref:C2 domain-containing protein n=1 Tax=Dracunculus medinensis TaxID=318479 RepID=A0A0N4URR9_DRAME